MLDEVQASRPSQSQSSGATSLPSQNQLTTPDDEQIDSGENESLTTADLFIMQSSFACKLSQPLYST